jgi:hypothetical protein
MYCNPTLADLCECGTYNQAKSMHQNRTKPHQIKEIASEEAYTAQFLAGTHLLGAALCCIDEMPTGCQGQMQSEQSKNKKPKTKETKC